MKGIRTIAAALVVGVLAVAPAFAQGPRGGGRAVGPAGRGAEIPLAQLNLTQAQQDSIKSIRERNREQMRTLQEQMRNEILSVLTPDQQAQVKQFQAQRQQRLQQRQQRLQQRQQRLQQRREQRQQRQQLR